jgi:hypothetical protein
VSLHARGKEKVKAPKKCGHRLNGVIDGEIMARIWYDEHRHMAAKYIHELPRWPRFTWDLNALASLLSHVRLRQGLLVGKMREYGLASRWSATLKILTEETIKSSAIEGVVLDPENVRSSLARKLGWRPVDSQCTRIGTSMASSK